MTPSERVADDRDAAARFRAVERPAAEAVLVDRLPVRPGKRRVRAVDAVVGHLELVEHLQLRHVLEVGAARLVPRQAEADLDQQEEDGGDQDGKCEPAQASVEWARIRHGWAWSVARGGRRPKRKRPAACTGRDVGGLLWSALAGQRLVAARLDGPQGKKRRQAAALQKKGPAARNAAGPAIQRSVSPSPSRGSRTPCWSCTAEGYR